MSYTQKRFTKKKYSKTPPKLLTCGTYPKDCFGGNNLHTFNEAIERFTKPYTYPNLCWENWDWEKYSSLVGKKEDDQDDRYIDMYGAVKNTQEVFYSVKVQPCKLPYTKPTSNLTGFRLLHS